MVFVKPTPCHAMHKRYTCTTKEIVTRTLLIFPVSTLINSVPHRTLIPLMSQANIPQRPFSRCLQRIPAWWRRVRVTVQTPVAAVCAVFVVDVAVLIFWAVVFDVGIVVLEGVDRCVLGYGGDGRGEICLVASSGGRIGAQG